MLRSFFYSSLTYLINPHYKMKRKILYTSLLLLVLLPTVGYAQSRKKFDRGVVKQTFVPKGQWFAGGTLSYSEHSNDNYKFIVLEDFTSQGYTLGVKPFFGYTIADNMGIGLAFTYKRSMLQIDNVSLSLGDDLSFGIADTYNLEHVYTGTAFMRNYINIGTSRRFGLYSDVKFQLGGGEGKLINGTGEALKGTYQKIYEAGILVSPGVCVFINDFAAVEVSIGVLGFQYKRIEQITNQVHVGSRQTSAANFKIDLLSLSLGIAFYL